MKIPERMQSERIRHVTSSHLIFKQHVVRTHKKLSKMSYSLGSAVVVIYLVCMYNVLLDVCSGLFEQIYRIFSIFFPLTYTLPCRQPNLIQYWLFDFSDLYRLRVRVFLPFAKKKTPHMAFIGTRYTHVLYIQ